MHGLDEQYGSKMKFRIVDYKAGDSPQLIERYELGQHGMVITDDEGNPVWSEPGHNQTRDGVTKAVQTALGK